MPASHICCEYRRPMNLQKVMTLFQTQPLSLILLLCQRICFYVNEVLIIDISPPLDQLSHILTSIENHKINVKMFCLFVWFDSLSPINNLSVIKGQVFLGWTRTKLGLMFLLKNTTQWRWWGSNPWPLGLESSTLPLSHCTPYVKMCQKV